MLNHFIIPLLVEGQHERATLVLSDAGDRGVLNLGKNHICDFELETPWSGNYFTAEKMARFYIEDLLGLEVELIDTGLSPDSLTTA